MHEEDDLVSKLYFSWQLFVHLREFVLYIRFKEYLSDFRLVNHQVSQALNRLQQNWHTLKRAQLLTEDFDASSLDQRVYLSFAPETQIDQNSDWFFFCRKQPRARLFILAENLWLSFDCVVSKLALMRSDDSIESLNYARLDQNRNVSEKVRLVRPVPRGYETDCSETFQAQGEVKILHDQLNGVP